MRKETTDIVKGLVESMSFTLDIDTIIDNLDGSYKLVSCNTYHLQECFVVNYEGIDWIITDVIKNISISIKPKLGSAPLPTTLTLTIYDPYYFSGTVIQTNLELEQIKDSSLKTPMIYLLEVLEDSFNNRDELNERESDLRLFFLTQANFEAWKTQDTYTNAIEPMRSLAYSFIDTLNKSKIIGTFAEYRLTNHTKFGVYTTDKGYTERIWNDDLAGVEMRITLPVLRDVSCNDFCS